MKWRAITSDESILSVVDCLILQFIDGRHPVQSTVQNSIKFSNDETVLLSEKIDNMLRNKLLQKLLILTPINFFPIFFFGSNKMEDIG